MHPLLGQFIAAFVGAVVALIAVYLTHRATLARSARERTLSKLEELLSALLKFSQQSQQLYDLALDVATSSDSHEFDPRLRQLREDRLETHSRIRLLSIIYYPALESVLNEVWECIIQMDTHVLHVGNSSNYSSKELKISFEIARKLSIQMRHMCIAEANFLLGRKQA